MLALWLRCEWVLAIGSLGSALIRRPCYLTEHARWNGSAWACGVYYIRRALARTTRQRVPFSRSPAPLARLQPDSSPTPAQLQPNSAQLSPTRLDSTRRLDLLRLQPDSTRLARSAALLQPASFCALSPAPLPLSRQPAGAPTRRRPSQTTPDGLEQQLAVREQAGARARALAELPERRKLAGLAAGAAVRRDAPARRPTSGATSQSGTN